MGRLRTFCVNLGYTVALGFVSLVSAANEAGHNPPHDLQQLRLATKEYLQDYYQNRFDAVEITVNRLDPRLRLAHCPSQLDFEVRDLTHNGGAITVKTQCLSAAPWSIYIGAQVNVFQNIVVASKALSRGDILVESDLTESRMNSSNLRSGYFTDNSDAIGKEVRRNIEAGEPLRDGILTIPLAINRGDIITLAASNGVIGVNTRAEALGSGRVGEQIRVRNLSSQRIVTANIVATGRVEVNP
ncbi:flagellar basal body P-ring formation protein FlgA [Gilvimarinus agarilyticus]|uniref:flagellar basal body P-ring formation chaperone FlgA n=1 Tax=unclassified Gilvimarinus TaxID=2642066 RepID=UPI001C09103F|nr:MULTISPECIES: flagellar basal body P-ring formation chaperone FlgA [unclassified Gilvimarinus]MBU2887263.1 flagellar basal body P-ring formation protein FlgA [Gilvimarinus agarilyticus]MDO6571922.1 flagellar basal body P-ring formation chaperone FlgA [Gilvimarinus sp. 2_MG-2023]MDO6745991.1 flagellar basal body P-ring formation chaperone FlgA [Gilvimarinus sp. 1_MG-2023]